MAKRLYYDPRIKGVFVVHRMEKTRIIISAPCRFLNDARSNIERYSITREYFSGCKIITERSPLVTMYKFDSGFTSPILKYWFILDKTPSIYQNPNFRYLDKATCAARREYDKKYNL